MLGFTDLAIVCPFVASSYAGDLQKVLFFNLFSADLTPYSTGKN